MTQSVGYMVFDTETTGLPVYARRGEPPIPADDPRQPRLASFAAILCDLNGNEQERHKYYIKPEGWTMKEWDEKARRAGKKPASAINGLTDDLLNEKGAPVVDVLADYSHWIKIGHIPCAFNATFDMKIMRGELRRAQMDDMFDQSANICLMKALHPYAEEGLPVNNFGDPNLTNACKFFGIPLNPHEVMSDANGAFELLRRLIADGRLPEPTVKRHSNYKAQKVPLKGETISGASNALANPPTSSRSVPDKF